MAVMLTNPLQVKDSRWLTLEVCREFTRNKCTRSETECKFAHPPPHVEVQNGRVTCCFDSIKGKCQRKDPPCKYLHPPQHLREQLLQNGRNNLILKNLQMQAIASSQIPQMVPLPPDKYRLNYGPNYQDQGQVLQHNPYLMQGTSMYSPYMGQTMPMASVITNLDQSNQQVPAGMMQANAGNQQKMQRADRLEPSTTSSGSGVSDSWPGSYVDSIAPSSHYSPVYFQPQVVEVMTPGGKKRPRDPGDDFITLGMSNLPTMMPMVKRPAVADSKSGIPMYQPGTGTAYQQAALAAMQLQQPFVPVTMSLIPNAQAAVTAAAAGALVTNATSVNYFDEANQLLDTLPVCRDFKSGQCKRPQCKYIHLVEDYVEVTDGKVTVCRDAAKGRCTRPMCKYYHIPMVPQLLV